MSKHTPQY